MLRADRSAAKLAEDAHADRRDAGVDRAGKRARTTGRLAAEAADAEHAAGAPLGAERGWIADAGRGRAGPARGRAQWHARRLPLAVPQPWSHGLPASREPGPPIGAVL